MALTNIDGKGGINILTETGDFKSTYEILLGISKVWKEMDDVSQAALLELVAGKTRGSVVAALFQNGDVLEQAYNSAAGASGSAMNELNTYLNSIQGRIDIFNNSLQTMWMNFIDSDALKIIVDMGTAAIRLVDSIGLLPTVIGGFSAFKLITKDVKVGLDAVNKSVEQSIASKQAEAAASEANAAAQAMENTQENAGVVAKEAGATAGWKDVVATNAQTAATKALAIAKGLLTGIVKGVAIMLASQVIGKAFEWIYKKIDDTIHHAEYLKEEVTELQQTYENAKKTFNENLTELTTSSDTKIYATLEDEFKRLTKGVDKYGNNISLTSDQYERYKEICEQIVGINPAIAAGYDDATKAIGNNASALSELIELQKTQQRQNVKDLLESENLDKIAENALNDYKSVTLEEGTSTYTSYNSVGQALRNSLSSEINDLLASGLNYNSSVNDDYMRLILERLGHEETTGIVESYWNQALGDYDFSRFINDYLNEIANNVDKFGDSYQGLINDAIGQYNQALKYNKNAILEARDGLVGTLLQVPFGEDAYDKLNDSSKNIIVEWIKNSEIFKIDPTATEEEVQTQLDDSVKIVQKLVNQFADENIQAIVDNVDGLDKSALTAREYLDEIRNVASVIWDAIGGENNQYGFTSKTDIEKIFGVDVESELNKWNTAIEIIANYLGKERSELTQHFDYKTMTREEMNAFLGIDWNAIGAENVKSISDVFDLINNVINSSDVISFKTYSALVESVTSYNDILSQTKEIVSDNTEVTEEYKEALIKLVGSEEKVNECFDENNEFVVKDAKALNNLVKAAKKNTAENVRLAKSQARLEYYELYKQMRPYYDAQGNLIRRSNEQILALYEEIGVLQKTIAEYSRLETQLLGTVNAYDKFQQAQEADTETDYISGIEAMVLALGEAFNTAELGTETARASIEGIVPESVYGHLDTVDEKLAAIYSYFKEGKIAQYFDLEFDEDGAITSAEMKLGNLRKFIEDGLGTFGDINDDGINPFEGTDWQHFEFSEAFLAEVNKLETAEERLQYFADQFKVTKDVAFAIIESINDHDAEWLNGDYGSMFDAFVSKSLEDKIYETTTALAELEAQMASNDITPEQYAEQYTTLSGELNNLGKSAREDIAEFEKLTAQIDAQKVNVNELTSTINTMHEKGMSWEDIKLTAEYKELLDASGVLTDLSKQLEGIEITEIVVQLAIDNIDAEIAAIERELQAKVSFGEDGEYKINVGVQLSSDEIAELEKYKKLWEERHDIEVNSDPDDAKTALEVIESAAQSALDVINAIDGTTITINTSSAISNVHKLADALKDLSLVDTATVTVSNTSSYSGTGGGLKGNNWTKKHLLMEAFADGTAHASGDWGLPQSEHNSLVGELGPELVRKNSQIIYLIAGTP